MSPKRHTMLTEVQNVLDNPVLCLVRAGGTRWTSNYRAVKAIRICLRSIVYALQEVHNDAADLASEAGGLLSIYQKRACILLIYALEQILLPFNILTLSLQSPKLSLADIPTRVDNWI